jgi:protein TonB
MTADPLSTIMRLGKRAARDGIYVGFIVALLSHTVAIASPQYTTWEMADVASNMRDTLHAYFWQEYDVVLDEEKDEATDDQEDEEVVEEVIEEEDEKVVEPEPKVEDAAEEEEEEAEEDNPYDEDEDEAPPPAEAPDALTADDDAQDMTGDQWAIVDKDGSKNTGSGYSSEKGKGNAIVRNRHARVGSKGKVTSKGKGKKKRRARKKNRNMSRGLGGSFRANCPFPPQANLHQVDKAVVQLLVTVGADGRVRSARVLSDPGYGFGRQAKRCVMAQKFPPALSSSGKAITMSHTLNYRFTRR